MYGMGEKYIFDIAVYSVSGERFFAEREKKLQEHFDWLNSMLPKSLKRDSKSNDSHDMGIRDYFKEEIWRLAVYSSYWLDSIISSSATNEGRILVCQR